MKKIDLSLKVLLEHKLPRIEPASLPLEAIRRDLKSAQFDWVHAAEKTLLHEYAGRLTALKDHHLLKKITFGPYSLYFGSDKLMLKEEGKLRWVIDADKFGGQPAIEVKKTKNADLEVVRITFRDAYYPGTLIPASFRADIYQAENIWTLRLRLRFGGFDATLPLSDWLNNPKKPASSWINLELGCCPLGPTSEMTGFGLGIAAFTPAFLLAAMGVDLFRLTGFKTNVTADAALVALLVPERHFILPNTWPRTGILLFSNQEFPLQPEFAAPAPQVHLGSFKFDAMALEAGLEPNGSAHRVLYALSPADAQIAGLEPGPDLWGSDGEPFRVPLTNPFYVQVFDKTRKRTAAGFLALPNPVRPNIWMHSPGLSLLLSLPRVPGFVHILEIPGQPLHVHCRLGLKKIAPHLPDLLVRPEPAPPSSDLIFFWSPPQEALEPNDGSVVIDAAAGSAAIRLPQDTSLAIVRRDDFLALGYEWSNLRLESRDKTCRLLPAKPGSRHLAVVFPPQSIGEEVFFQEDKEFPISDTSSPPPDPPIPPPTSIDTPPLPPVKALLAKPSRLVFTWPQPQVDFPLTTATLLNWEDLKPSLAKTALPGGVWVVQADGKKIIFLPGTDAAAASEVSRPVQAVTANSSRILGNLRPLERFVLAKDIVLKLLKPEAPTKLTTQIELPFRLILSPNRYGAWVHARDPVTRGGRTELWHTRLGYTAGNSILEGLHPCRTVRAIWSRDHDFKAAYDKPFLMSLDGDDRRQLVHLTSDYSQDFTPRTVAIKRLMLSALGGWLDAEYRAEPPTSDYSIELWRHQATLGRDHYVRVVYKGFLLPFGHRASVVKISERKVELTRENDPAAYLRQRVFIIVREPERSYDASGYEHEGREMPFKKVRITTLVTPNLSPPQESPLGDPPANPLVDPPLARFWPMVDNMDFQFHLKAWDWDGREIDFNLPLAFVRSDRIPGAVDDYNKDKEERRKAELGGQQVALAESGGDSPGNTPGNTTFDTQHVVFKAIAPYLAPPEPPFYPELAEAAVDIAALRQMSGKTEAATVELDSRYLDYGFQGEANKAELFLIIKGPLPRLDYKTTQSADRAGGVATPSLDIRGLSRRLGAVGDTSDDFAGGTFNPQNFFTVFNAQLLGGISLIDILNQGTPLEDAPKLLTTNTGNEITTTLNWTTSNFKAEKGFFPDDDAKLNLQSTLKTAKSGGAKIFELKGTLTNFTINLGRVVKVKFKEFTFRSLDGRKPEVHVDIAEISFDGALQFLKALEAILSPVNFKDPPFMDVTPSGITAGYNLTLPSVAFGVFSLLNLALGARLTLPFTGDPMRLRFNISERHSPFIVSVAPFGGGGFFALAVGLDEVEVLEASLEFGGNVSINLGTASGGIYLMAGIYFRLEVTTNVAELTGYVRAGGALQVLGLITISMEFYQGLAYNFDTNEAWGECRVTVKVEVAFFSKSVSVTMRKQFAGSSNDPPFRVMMPYSRWLTYCQAFA